MIGMGKSHEVPAESAEKEKNRIPVYNHTTNAVDFVPKKDVDTGKFGKEQREVA